MLPAGKAMEAINRVAFPILAKGRADSAWLARIHQQLIGLLALYGFGACWGLAGVSQEFVAVVLGSKWQGIAQPLAVLSLIAPLRMLCSLHNTITTAVGSPQATTLELLVSGVVLPAAIALGAWWNGIFGASMAWLLAFPPIYLFSNALTCSAINRRQWAGIRPVCFPLTAGLSMLTAIWMVREFMPTLHLIALLLLEILVGATVYLTVLWLVARPLLREARTLAMDLLRSRPANPPV